MHFEGYNGRITIEQDDLVISREGVRGRFGGDLERRIALDDIDGAYLELPPEPRRPGYLQLVLADEDEDELTRAQAAVHPDVVTFSAKQLPDFQRLHDWLENGGDLAPAPAPTAAARATPVASSADQQPVPAPSSTSAVPAPQEPSRAASQGKLTPVEAVRSALSQYVTFSGRARRSEYWWFTLASVLFYAVCLALDYALGLGFLSVVASLLLLLPGLSVTWRRLHDTDHSGGWYFISLVPIVGAIILLVFLVRDSQPGPNRFGPSPK